MNKREPNAALMAQWTQAWTTLGRWQELNARLSREPATNSGWARRSMKTSRWPAVPAVVSAMSS